MTSTACSVTTDKTFKKDVLKSDKIVLVDFGATWCGPCKKLSPIVDKVAKEMKDTICVFKVDVDESPKISKKYKVVAVPFLIIFKNGKSIATKEGFISKSKLIEWIKENC
uniref:Thioredoxin n=1 Tax=Marseillevirus LCMAC101 TaxID=2506602 RepID=A0A481YSM7_9VIRU|nr:MAG: thioredoxin [Marseillevirus LCMAC101]